MLIIDVSPCRHERCFCLFRRDAVTILQLMMICRLPSSHTSADYYVFIITPLIVATDFYRLRHRFIVRLTFLLH